MNSKILCKFCHTPVTIRKSMVYMRCMCDDEVRIVPFVDINRFKHENLYLLTAEGTYHDKMEKQF